ncbi:unnamed protein product [Ceutorhynchus assimilis]|uniref:CHK kinase-like domain-containing protein n=1 Tax=Ceutorhynchus assimilis TaxID=467358 RepID=A0A9N9MNF7_9CUCU|nr:unnamed protein product [Ceutorhynchus assimilis]
MSELSEIKNLRDLVKDRIEGEILEQAAKRLVPPGENYGSIIYKVDFSVKNDDSTETYHAVAKCTPPNKVTQEVFNTQITFKTEIGWYTTVIPTYKEFQKEKGVKEADFFQHFLGARISLDPDSDVVDEYGCILTKNLISLGYKNVDRHEGFDLKTAKSVLRDLAKYHAIPWALKQQNPKLFAEKILPFMPKYPNSDDDSVDFMASVKQNLRNMPEITEYLDRVIHVLDNNKPFDFEFVPREPWATITHTDFWSNNIMVTDEDEPKTIILDLQGTRYGSLASDVLFLFALSIKLDVNEKHMDALIEHYWTNFVGTVKELDSDVTGLTYEGFLEELSLRAKSELGHALFIGQFIFLEKGVTHFDSSDKDFKKEDLDSSGNVEFGKKHRDRFSWVIKEFARRNWI